MNMMSKTGKVFVLLVIVCTFAGCEQANDSADKAARDLTGSNMVQQEKAMKEKLKDIEAAQKQQLQDVE